MIRMLTFGRIQIQPWWSEEDYDDVGEFRLDLTDDLYIKFRPRYLGGRGVSYAVWSKHE